MTPGFLYINTQQRINLFDRPELGSKFELTKKLETGDWFMFVGLITTVEQHYQSYVGKTIEWAKVVTEEQLAYIVLAPWMKFEDYHHDVL